MGVLFRSPARVHESHYKVKLREWVPYSAFADKNARLKEPVSCKKAAAGSAALRLRPAFMAG
jgi:hypothetical protein